MTQVLVARIFITLTLAGIAGAVAGRVASLVELARLRRASEHKRTMARLRAKNPG